MPKFIKNIAVINPKSSKSTYEYINYIDTSSVLEGKLLQVQRLDDNFPSRAQRELQKNDILISSVRPNLKHNYFIKNTVDNLIGSTGFIQVRIIDNSFLPQYIYYYLTTNQNVELYTNVANSSQTTFPAFNKEVIENVRVADISLNEQRHIVDTI